MPGNGRDRLSQAALDLDFQKIARLVREGHRSDEAFLSDQGQTLDPDDQEENKAIVERVSAELGVHVENEDQLLMEVYSTLIQAGHPPPDGPARRCVARVLGSATGDRCERAAVLMRPTSDPACGSEAQNAASLGSKRPPTTVARSNLPSAYSMVIRRVLPERSAPPIFILTVE